MNAVPAEVGRVQTVLADTGYAAIKPVTELQEKGVEVLVALGRHSHGKGRTHDFRPLPKKESLMKFIRYKKPWAVAMKKALEDERGQRLYRLRKQTVEPVFGIVKQAMGFRQFLLRGLGKVNLEWQLVLCAYNLK